MNEYTDNDLETQIELIGIFHQKSLNDLKILKKNIKDGENKQWSETSHALKGSTAYIGANYLKKLCAEAHNMMVDTKANRELKYNEIEKEHLIVCEFLRDKNLLNF